MRAGRPRDEGVRRAILVAAQELVLERGYAAVTMGDVAKRAGAGKQTLYRWWPGKGALVLDAFSEWVSQAPRLRGPRRPSLSSTLVELCRGASEAAPVLRALMAEAQFDEDLHRRLLAQLVRPRGDELRACLVDRRPADRELVVNVLSGLVWQRLMLNEPLDARFVRFALRVVERI
ncbi:transcriptional regulator, TetR family [Myxococcus fulvus]|uniref:TetR family transcriptional regulator n=1 Tax=Myxococcus fulvus TaxID=33 RepID=A0A511TH28_MYXFU|nr:TetR/AcrR family transcriptional regulator [Myxococcus fulvus]GEN12943.1 TetR family transcriptional regulator [Myxococcus fulvus]SEU38514.1 transcriptional regulator, TetR family [Myxococcus fulvus]